MVRKPPFQRPPRRRSPLPLRRANALMDEGRFAEAADLFVRLSQGARRRGMPIRAANLAVRASQAFLAQDRPEPALRQVRLAIRILVRHGETGRAAHLLSRATEKLTEKGLRAKAEELAQYLDQLRQEAGLPLGDQNTLSRPDATSHRGSLPGRCTGCGAPLLADEVLWHDARTAECPYCGAVAKTE